MKNALLSPRAWLLTLLAVALILGPLAPFATPPASANTGREVWSATLTVQNLTHGDVGCSGSACLQHLTDARFTYLGTSLTIEELSIGGSNGRLKFNFNTSLPAEFLQRSTLHVDGVQFPLSEAFAFTGGFDMPAGDVSWSAGDTPRLRLTAIEYAGDLDPTFGFGGKLTTAFNSAASEIHAVAEYPDTGRIVAVGFMHNGTNKDFAIARYNPDGSLDGSFGTGGLVITDISGDDEARAVAIQLDGKIVVAGSTTVGGGFDFAVVRYKGNGTLDTDFDTDGKQTTNMGANDVPNAVGLDSNDKIVLAGYAGNDFGVARYTDAGALDATFSTDGKFAFDFDGQRDAAHAMVIQSDNKIVLAGYFTEDNGTASNTADDHKDFALARITAAGELDSTFDTDGKQTSGTDGQDELRAVTLGSSGKIVAAGFTDASNAGDFYAVVRANTNGSLDTTFDTDGVSFGAGFGGVADPRAHAVAVVTGGKIVIAGRAGADFGIARLNANGSVDETVGTTIGARAIDIGGGDDRARAMVVTHGGIVLGGYSSNGSNNDFALARVVPTTLTLDDEFGIGGVVTTAFGSNNFQAEAMALQSDGKIVVAGYAYNGSDNDFAVARYNPNGSLDTAFGTGGRVVTDIGTGSSDQAQAVAIDSSGNIVVAGHSSDGTFSNNDFAVARYTSAGALDTNFSGDGKVTTDFASNSDQAHAVAVLGNGKIVAAGGAISGGSGLFALARYNANGTLDTTFDTDGKVTTSIKNWYANVNGVAVQSDGKIVAAGSVTNSTRGFNEFALARYTDAGALDTTFGEVLGSAKAGFVVTVVGDGHAWPQSVAVQSSDGKIVAAGLATVGSTQQFALVRYTSAGVLDTTFSTDGKIATGFGTGHARAQAVALQSDGRIVAAGFAYSGTSNVRTNEQFALARYRSDGALDITFGVAGIGKVTTDCFVGDSAAAHAMALQSDGKILLAGLSNNGRSDQFALARYLGQGTPSTDATLSALSVSTSSDGTTFDGTATLEPAFTPSTTAYSATLAGGVTHVKVTPTLTYPDATVSVRTSSTAETVASGTASAAIMVPAGSTTTVNVAVTAEDGSTTLTYALALKVPDPDDATLSALSVGVSRDGGANFRSSATLSPEVDPATMAYTAEMSTSATHIQVTPTANNAGAGIVVNGQATASGAASPTIPVSTESVSVVVTSPSGVATLTYTVTLQVGLAPGQVAGDAVWFATLKIRDLNNDGVSLGCGTGSGVAAADQCDSDTTLTEDFFLFAGATSWEGADDEAAYSRLIGAAIVDVLVVENVGANAPRTLKLSFTQNVSEGLRTSLVLVFDGRVFPLRDGVVSPADTITWADSGIGLNEYADDQVVDVSLFLNPVGPSVTEWQPKMNARRINNSHAKAGCGGDVDCSDPTVVGGNRFSVNAPKYGGLRSYYIKELTVEFVARYGHDEVYRRVTLTVEEGGGTVDLNGTSLELTYNGQSIRLPIRHQNRVGNTNTWVWGLEKGSALAWGSYSTVGVRIIPVTTGLQTVRVYYDEMNNGQPVDGFLRWDIARAKPHATLGQALIAVIPGDFVSVNTGEKAITTHAKLLLRGDWPGSTIEYRKGNWDAPPTSGYVSVGSDGLTGAISLNAEKSNTYVWVKVTNGAQVHTHLVIIDPPPRTFSVNQELRIIEGETGQVTVSLGSPATKGGVSFTVTTDYGDGVTADDVGEIVSTVTIPEGQQSASIAVPTIQDEEIEADERFTVTLTHVGEPLWAVEPGKTGTTTVTIVNDDVGREPWNIQVTPGDGQLTVTWNVSSRDGYEDSEIWHVLRWSQEFGVWANPRDPRAVGKNDGLSVDPGVTTYTITGLENGVATGVFIRSMVGYRTNMSERSGDSSKWVRTKGVHTTPVAPPNETPTVASTISDATIVSEDGTHQASLSGVFSDADGDDLTVTTTSSDETVATASVSADYATLTVSAQGRGSATITVTADDGAATVEDTFTVTVKAAPTVASAIADVSELEADATHQVSLSGVFNDADGDSLTVTASSSKDAVATVAVAADYSGLTLTGKAAGTAAITVTAQDSDGNTVSDAFDVTVIKVNNPPTVTSGIADATIVNQSGTHQVSLSGVFSDADSDNLTITAESSSTSVATASVSADYATLTVSAQSRGSATITVTAADGNGGSVEDSFTVTVKAAPVVASAIADVSELAIDATHEVSMSGVFSDADSDALTISATTSDSTVAQVANTIDPSTGSATAITVIGVAAGTATITVTARDSDGNSVTDAFDVTVPAAQQQGVELPGPVVSLELTASAENSVTVTWSAPETGGAPDGYIVHLKPENGEKGSGKTKRPKATKTQVKFNNLQPGQTYQVWARAQNEAGKGERVHASITLPESGDGQTGQ